MAVTSASGSAEPRRRSARIGKKEKTGEEGGGGSETPVAIRQRKALKRQSATLATAAAATPPSRRSKRAKVEVEVEVEDAADAADLTPPRRVKRPASSSTPARAPRTQRSTSEPKSGAVLAGAAAKPAKSLEDKAAQLRAKKLRSYAQFAKASPFPSFTRPTAQECQQAYQILANLHGERTRPVAKTAAAPRDVAGCGDSPSVLDALVRTILSQNTSNANSTRAKLGMDAAYGGCDRWEEIAAGGQGRLQEAIRSGGLAGVKSRVVLRVLESVKQKYGAYSLDHLFGASAAAESPEEGDEAVMRELLAFPGVGPKTASCVLLFCLGRPSFAVDTHVYRLTGPSVLGWRPSDGECDRDAAFAHLNARVPDGLKYGLHVLLITHGRTCEECKAGGCGKKRGKCLLRRAFRSGDGGEGSEEGEEGVDDRGEEEVKFEEGVMEANKQEVGDEREEEEKGDLKKTGRVAIAHAVEHAS